MIDTLAPATESYTGGDYKQKNPDWHLSDAPNKAKDLVPSLCAVIAAAKTANRPRLRLADVGAGVGGVLAEVVKLPQVKSMGLEIEPVGFEISPQAVAKSGEVFPEMDMRQKFFQAGDGPFDAVMFIDVLEHLENPWELVRAARSEADYMIVRQPLQENFSTFRLDNYRDQRLQWGHVSYFNYHSFLDMAAASGWEPLKVDLVASWELAGVENGGSLAARLMVKANRVMASYLVSGFYLNGAFRRA